MPIYKMEGKKNGLQKYRVRINYTDKLGKPKQIDRVAYGKDEAKALEIRLMNEFTSEGGAVKRMNVAELVSEYLTSKKSEVRETSLDKTRRMLERYIIPKLGNNQVAKLTAPILQDWKNQIETEGYALKTKQNIYGEFRALLNYAVKMEYIPKNPLLIIGNFKDTSFSKPQDKIRYYTPEQFLKYIDTARKCADNADTFSEWSFYVFFATAYYTGMRKGEINALKWSDIDGDILHVRRSVAQKIAGKKIVETPPKNKSSYRDLQIPQPLINILAEHKQRQQGYFGSLFTDDFRVCSGSECLADTSIDKHNRKYAQLAELPRITVHEFRHSHASLLANEGINIQEIARRLGHSKIEITWNTYSHLYPREEERAILILNKIV